MRFELLQKIHDLTGKNALFELDKDNLKNSDPEVIRVLIWLYRQQENKELKLEDVTDFTIGELAKSYEFFRG